jgi:predicted O-methyltransferase YrrM
VEPHDRKLSGEYARTYVSDDSGDSMFLNPQHASIMEAVASVEGQLQPVDAEKLYEMAFQARGPILEIGCFHGKSTTVMALAAQAAGHRNPLVSVDINPEYCAIAECNVRLHVADADVRFVIGPSAKVVPRLELDFAFAFVDGNHRYAAVRGDLLAVHQRLLPGAFVLLHDFYDLRNEMPPEAPRYGVIRAAEEVLPANGYTFRGRFGCTALYQRVGRRAGERSTSGGT